jgi:L-amino acid N-acyltransferase YncA
MLTIALQDTQSTHFTLASHPTWEQLQSWWETMHGDPSDVEYMISDTSPRSLVDFQKRAHSGQHAHHCLLLEGGFLAASLWLHDLVRDKDHIVRAGWVAVYIVPAYRGRSDMAMWRLARDYLQRQGVTSLFAAVHTANGRSRIFARRMGFHPVGKIYHFRRDQSRHPINAAIYTLHPEDRAFAWQQALQRAARLQTVELAQSA